jgi:hypothetical protein
MADKTITIAKQVRELRHQIRAANDQLEALGLELELPPRVAGKHEAEIVIARSDGWIEGYAKASEELLEERRKQRHIAWISFIAGWLGGVLSFVTGIVLSNL